MRVCFFHTVTATTTVLHACEVKAEVKAAVKAVEAPAKARLTLGRTVLVGYSGERPEGWDGSL